MIEVEDIPSTYVDAVRTLAEWNGEAGADDLIIFAAEDLGDNMVRLIHVSEHLPDVGPIPVYHFGASAEFPFPSQVALARPEQWRKIQSRSGDCRLPPDWKIEKACQVWPVPEA